MGGLAARPGVSTDVSLSLVIAALFAAGAANAGCARPGTPDQRPQGAVVVSRTPHGGIQPQAVVDPAGTLHLAYYSGAPDGGNVFYVRRMADESSFSQPVRVNSQPGSAIALGTVRGAHMALGRGGRVHLAWNGSGAVQPAGPRGAPMLYARSNDSGTAFEPQRNLISWAAGIDGGGTVAADSQGTVYVAWHAGGEGTDDAHRAVYLTRSTDDGVTFERERQVGVDGAGACACCGMSSAIDSASRLYLFYRAARRNVDREMTALWSMDRGETFSAMPVHNWQINACPLTTSAMFAVADGALAAWDTGQQIYFAALGPDRAAVEPRRTPAGPATRGHPGIARNGKGETLLAWTVNASWGRGGAVEWQVYDGSGAPTTTAGQADGLPVWGSLAAAVAPDGRFLLFY